MYLCISFHVLVAILRVQLTGTGSTQRTLRCTRTVLCTVKYSTEYTVDEYTSTTPFPTSYEEPARRRSAATAVRCTTTRTLNAPASTSACLLLFCFSCDSLRWTLETVALSIAADRLAPSEFALLLLIVI